MRLGVRRKEGSGELKLGNAQANARGPPQPPVAPCGPPPQRPPPLRASQVSVGLACGWVRTLSFSQAAGGLLRVLGGGPPLAGLVGAAERHQAPWLPRPASSGTALTGHTHWRRPPASSPRPAPTYEAAVASFRVKGHGHCDRVVAKLRDRPRRPTQTPARRPLPRRGPGPPPGAGRCLVPGSHPH